MKVDLPLHGHAVATSATAELPRACELPPAGFKSRRARLPALVRGLATSLLGERAPGEDTAVIVGTALGCLTETAAFVENMIEGEGAAPKPRAFTASVHNAIASELARQLGARGECQTFVGGESSLVQALFAAWRLRARGHAGEVLVGAVDEWTEHVARGRAACDASPEPAEGGALFRVGPAGEAASARLCGLAWGRPEQGARWLRRELEEQGVEAVLVSPACNALVGEDVASASFPAGDFPSAAAVALGCLVARLSGELEARALGLPPDARRLAVATRTRLGELSLIVVEPAA